MKLAFSPWTFLVVIARIKDGELRFSTDYQPLNKRMKGNMFPIANIPEIVDGLGGATVFTKLNIIYGYWKIDLEEHV